ncbi:MAG: UbiD family decarboxylase [Synergistales bacterium]|nr:UbiD family decarboxylase [Synergistales bacterium]
MEQSLRAALNQLEEQGAVHVVDRPVELRYELGAVLSEKRRGPALYFSNVAGATMPVVGNLFTTRARLARLLGADTPAELQRRCIAGITSGRAAEVVASGPVQACRMEPPIGLKERLPVPTWFEREGGPYITAGVIVAKDPETGKRNVSIARFRVEEEEDTLLAGISPSHHLSRLMEKATARGESLPLAIVIGNHPAVLLASQMYVALGHDEFDIAGALLGEPLRLVPCTTVDLEVPAEAEIVLEGHLHPGNLVDEGPVSEFHGFYEHYGPGQLVKVTALTHRRDPLYQAILPGFAPEHLLLGGEAIAATTCRALQEVIPAVQRVVVTEGGMGRLHAVVTLHAPRAGEARRAIALAMGHTNLLKFVTAVDDDVDPENPLELEWALAARFRGEEDLLALPGMRADRCDPQERAGTVTKIGMDCTLASDDRSTAGGNDLAAPPREILEKVRKEIRSY